MTVRLTTLALMAMLAAAGGGCAVAEDPREGNLFSGVVGLGSGTYDRRLEQKRQALEQAESERARLRDELGEVETEQARVAAERAAADERLVDLGLELDQLSDRLADARQRQALEEEELRQLQDEVLALDQAQALLADSPGIDADAKARRLQELELRKQQLEEALVEALGQ